MSRELKIERRLALNTINAIEEVTGKMISETHPELEKLVLDTYYNSEKDLRRVRLNLDQILDDLRGE